MPEITVDKCLILQPPSRRQNASSGTRERIHMAKIFPSDQNKVNKGIQATLSLEQHFISNKRELSYLEKFSSKSS